MFFSFYPTRIVIFFFLIIGLVAPKAYSQNGPFDNIESGIIPPTPKAAALAQYGNHPVSYFTGTPNIAIPLTSLESGGVEVPVSLSYHASGIKVAQKLGNYGLGWVLNAGGAIIITVRGGWEDGMSHGFNNERSNFSSHFSSYTILEKIAHFNIYDTQPDDISYNFLNYSGKIIQKFTTNDVEYIDKKGGNLKFTRTSLGWLALDESGNEYYFEEKEFVRNNQQDEVSTSYYLSRIITAENNKLITFTYNSSSYTSPPSHSERTSLVTHGNSCGSSPLILTSSTLTYQRKVIDKIIIDNEEIDINNNHTPFPSNSDPDVRFNGIIHKKNGLVSKEFRIEARDIPTTTGNDSRVVLEKIVSLNLNGGDEKKWSFEYNNVDLLPDYDSKSIDHWGFYNGSGNSLLPSFSKCEYNLISSFNGTDRETDPVKVLYGTISKITYPTGGYTNFEFEPHQYEEVVPVYVDETARAKVGPSGVGQVTVNFNLDHDQLVTVNSTGYCHPQGTGSHTYYNGQVFAVCQNIVKTDYYCESAGSKSISAFMDIIGDIADISVHYKSISHYDTIVKYRGGVRIKNIKSYSAQGELLKAKDFLYENIDGSSSHVLASNDPVYNFLETEKHYKPCISGIGNCPDFTCSKFSITSASSNRTINGSSTVYTSVLEREEGNGQIQRNYSASTLLNGTPVGPDDNLTGQGDLKKITYYSESGNKVYEEGFSYQSQILSSFNGYAFQLKTTHTDGSFADVNDFYQKTIPMNASWNKLTSKTTKIFDENGLNPIVNTTNYFYNQSLAHNKPIMVETTNSDGTVYTEEYKYSFDYDINASSSDEMANAIYEMKQRNILTTPIEVSNWYNEGSGNYLVSSRLSTYRLITKNGKSAVKPAMMYKTEVSTPISESTYTESNIVSGQFVYDSHFEPVLSFNEYNDNFNLVEVEQINGLKYSYGWSEDGNKLYSRHINSSFSASDYNGFEDRTADIVTDAYTGEKAVYGSSGNLYNLLTVTCSDGLESDYHFSGYVKTDPNNTNSPWIVVRAYRVNSSGQTLLGTLELEVVGSTNGNWELREIDLDLSEYSLLNGQIGAGDELMLNVSMDNCTAASLVTFDDFRLQPENTLTNTYAYNSRFGLSEIMNANDRKAVYKYDNFGRLEQIFNEDGEILKEMEYHYQTAGEENYIKVSTPRIPMTSIASNATPYQVNRDISYFDGLGRSIQQIAIAATPSQKDLISPIEYDALGRQQKKYLPYTDGVYSGDFRNNWATDQASFYTTATDVANSTVPFSEQVFNNSPENRVIESSAPGTDWQLGNGHTTEQLRRANYAHEVLNFKVNASGNAVATSTYAANELSVSITIDEEDRATLTFTDKMGRKIMTQTNLSRQQAVLGNGSQVAGNDAADFIDPYYSTYYVYNQKGQLTHVIPPLATERMDVINVFDADLFNYGDLIYFYRYDEAGRIYEKKVPGAGWTSYVYDNLDRPVLSQNAKMADESSWNFVKYDQLGREVYTGLFNTEESRDELQTAIDNFYSNSSNYNYELRSNTNTSDYHGYSNQAYPNEIEVLTVNYYDDYDFNNDGTADYVFNNKVLTPINLVPGLPNPNISNIPVYRLKEMQTGSKVKVLNDGTIDVNWIESANFYDKKGQLIQTLSNNHLEGGSEQVDNFYNFNGEIEHRRRIHNNGESSDLTILNRYNYDQRGRLVNTYEKVNTQGVVVVSQQNYNTLGQLKEKNLHSTNLGQSFIQSVDYSYNIRGWLLSINDVDLAVETNDLWGMELSYNQSLPTAFNGNVMYNGNITFAQWKDKKGGEKKAYSYEYDVTNRLISAHYKAYNTGGWTEKVDYYSVPKVEYDANGNIHSLDRKGQLQNLSFGLMDQLTYTHDGNRLKSVNDAITSGGVNDFVDGANLSTEYIYDASGNLIEDKNKNILIQYNHLNLPTMVYFASGESIKYYYLADGTKIRKTPAEEGGNLPVTDYIGGIHYEGGNLKFFTHDEGRVMNDEGGFRYEYTYKDHLGNSRLSFSDLNSDGTISTNTEVLQITDYYPFGLEHNNNNNVQIGPKNLYLYNNKELQNDFNLNWYDYGARFYNPTLGVWGQVDPLAEKMVGYSPYSYTFNNPLKFADPTGMEPEFGDLTGQRRAMEFISGGKERLDRLQKSQEENEEGSNEQENLGDGNEKGDNDKKTEAKGGGIDGEILEDNMGHIFEGGFISSTETKGKKLNNDALIAEVNKVVKQLGLLDNLGRDILAANVIAGVLKKKIPGSTAISVLAYAASLKPQADAAIILNVTQNYLKLHKDNTENMQGVYRVYRKSGHMFKFGSDKITLDYYDVYTGIHLGGFELGAFGF